MSIDETEHKDEPVSPFVEAIREYVHRVVREEITREREAVAKQTRSATR